MDRQTLRDWVIRYNEHGVDGLGDRWGAGRPTAVSEGQLAAVKGAILEAACRSGDAKPAFRIVDVAALIEERTGVRYSISGAHRLMKTMELSYQKTRPTPPEIEPVSALKNSLAPTEADRKGAGKWPHRRAMVPDAMRQDMPGLIGNTGRVRNETWELPPCHSRTPCMSPSNSASHPG
jgi:transposase